MGFHSWFFNYSMSLGAKSFQKGLYGKNPVEVDTFDCNQFYLLSVIYECCCQSSCVKIFFNIVLYCVWGTNQITAALLVFNNFGFYCYTWKCKAISAYSKSNLNGLLSVSQGNGQSNMDQKFLYSVEDFLLWIQLLQFNRVFLLLSLRAH